MITYEVRVHSDGTKYWCIDGKLHREDGPAVEFVDGTKEWWLNGKQLTEEEFNARQNCVGKAVEIEGKSTALKKYRKKLWYK